MLLDRSALSLPLLGRSALVLNRARSPLALGLPELALVLLGLVAEAGIEGLQRGQLRSYLIADPKLLCAKLIELTP